MLIQSAATRKKDRFIHPSISLINEIYCSIIPFEKRCPDTWHNFLKNIGVAHINFTRLVVIDKKKFFLAKIKHGI